MDMDCYFEIGSSHEACQDYALTGHSGDIGFAIVTDGCSESHNVSGQADLGARIVAYAARKVLMRQGSAKALSDISKGDQDFKARQELLRSDIMQYAVAIGQQLDLSPLYSDCTLLITIVAGNKANLFMFGDGVAAIKLKNGDLSVIDVSYLSGAPYYPSYPIDPERLTAYAKEFGGSPLHIKQSLHMLNGLTRDGHNQVGLIDPSIAWDNTSFTFNDVESISVMSDGVKSYQKQNGDSVTDALSEDVIKSFVDFKNTKGVFVQRRMKALKKEHKKLSMIHFDDISIATVVA